MAREHMGPGVSLEYGLEGRSFRLVMDNGHEYAFRFLNGETVQWAERGEPFRWEPYQCLRTDATTWFVVLELSGRALRTCLTMVLDEAASLVTMHWAQQGGVPGKPRMTETDIVFGAISRPGQALPVKRHAYTADLVGKKINWDYGNGFINTHIYTSEMYGRAKPVTRGLPPNPTQEDIDRNLADDEREKVWIYEEPTRCVRIKEGTYLVSFIEQNLNKVDSTKGGNNFLLLANLPEHRDVCRSFRLDESGKRMTRLLTAHGELTQEDIDIEHVPSPYRV